MFIIFLPNIILLSIYYNDTANGANGVLAIQVFKIAWIWVPSSR